MKTLLLILMINTSIASEVFYVEPAGFVSLKTNRDSIELGLVQVINNKPMIARDTAKEIVVSAGKAAKKYGIPLNVVLAIAFVESSYVLNSVNKASDDYGIMQVNQWHVKKSKLKVYKLLTEYDYSFEHGVRIFSWFYRKYPLDEAIARYNCGTRKSCPTWSKVKKYVDKVKGAM